MTLTEIVLALKAGECILIRNKKEQNKLLPAFDESGLKLRIGEPVSTFVKRIKLPFPYVVGRAISNEETLFWDWPQSYEVDCRIKKVPCVIYTLKQLTP